MIGQEQSVTVLVEELTLNTALVYFLTQGVFLISYLFKFLHK